MQSETRKSLQQLYKKFKEVEFVLAELNQTINEINNDLSEIYRTLSENNKK